MTVFANAMMIMKVKIALEEYARRSVPVMVFVPLI